MDWPVFFHALAKLVLARQDHIRILDHIFLSTLKSIITMAYIF
uniref:Uncharacterized protein n=1 Tax=Ascaris lumbricoides TaxID=6252 RepID=A0A0M3IQ80_ASCLU